MNPRSAAGMVLHISEEVQKVPITHKAAMRRFVMEVCDTTFIYFGRICDVRVFLFVIPEMLSSEGDY